MSHVKTPKVLILIALVALVGAMLVAGCGGSGGTTATNQGPPPGSNAPEATEETEAAEEPAEEGEPAEAEPAEETEEAPAEEAPAVEEAGGEEEGASAAMVAEGKTIFTTNCGSCHTLAAAGTSGTIGPNLDELEPADTTVEQQVINGGGPMPAFGKEGTLNPEEVKAVSAYVSSVAGSE